MDVINANKAIRTEVCGPPPLISSEADYPIDGSSLASYRNLLTVGTGGMARVYAATDSKLGRKVAVKVLKKGLAAPTDLQDRFRREIAILSKQMIPGVVPILNAGEADGWPYYVMPLVEGTELGAYLEKLDVDYVSRMALLRRLARIVSVMHGHGITHGDLTPHNILVDSHGELHILDFGLARALDPEIEAIHQTQVGTVIGTPAYMAPELLDGYRGSAAAAAGDVFSLGVIVHETLNGNLPYPIQGIPTNLLAETIRSSPPPAQLSGSKTLSATIIRALAPEPGQRPQACELELALADYNKETPRSSFSAVALVGVCLFFVVVAGLLIDQSAVWEPDSVSGANTTDMTPTAGFSPPTIAKEIGTVDDAGAQFRLGEPAPLVTSELSREDTEVNHGIKVDSPPEERTPPSKVLTLVLMSAMDPAYQEIRKSLAGSDSLSGKGALHYRLPPSVVMVVRQDGLRIMRIDSRFQRSGTIYRADGRDISIEIGDAQFDWNPMAGKIAVFELH